MCVCVYVKLPFSRLDFVVVFIETRSVQPQMASSPSYTLLGSGLVRCKLRSACCSRLYHPPSSPIRMVIIALTYTSYNFIFNVNTDSIHLIIYYFPFLLHLFRRSICRHSEFGWLLSCSIIFCVFVVHVDCQSWLLMPRITVVSLFAVGVVAFLFSFGLYVCVCVLLWPPQTHCAFVRTMPKTSIYRIILTSK